MPILPIPELSRDKLRVLRAVLTEREFQYYEILSKGISVKAVAAYFNRTPSTIERARETIAKQIERVLYYESRGEIDKAIKARNLFGQAAKKRNGRAF